VLRNLLAINLLAKWVVGLFVAVVVICPEVVVVAVAVVVEVVVEVAGVVVEVVVEVAGVVVETTLLRGWTWPKKLLASTSRERSRIGIPSRETAT